MELTLNAIKMLGRIEFYDALNDALLDACQDQLDLPLIASLTERFDDSVVPENADVPWGRDAKLLAKAIVNAHNNRGRKTPSEAVLQEYDSLLRTSGTTGI